MGYGVGCDCMCNATMWKLDPVDGSIIWRSDRDRTATTSLTSNSLYVSGTDIYECGSRGPSHGHLTRWDESSGRPVRVWDYDYGDSVVANFDGMAPSGTQVIASVEKGPLSHPLVSVLAADGSFVAENATGLGEMNAAFPAASGGVYMFRTTAAFHTSLSALAYLVDSSLAIADEDTDAGRSYRAFISDDPRNGFVVNNGVSGNRKLRTQDAAFTVTAETSQNGYVFYRSGNATKCVHVGSASGSVSRVDIATASLDWTNPISFFGGIGAAWATVDDSGNVYVLYNSSSTEFTLSRLAAATGTVEWSATLGSPAAPIGARRLVACGNRIIVVGRHTYVPSDTSKRAVLIAYNTDTGDREWMRNVHVESGILTLQYAQYVGGYLYVCGPRGRLLRETP